MMFINTTQLRLEAFLVRIKCIFEFSFKEGQISHLSVIFFYRVYFSAISITTAADFFFRFSIISLFFLVV